MKQENSIPPSDSNEIKTAADAAENGQASEAGKAPADDPTTELKNDTSPPLFDATGAASPVSPTPGAVMPQTATPEAKRGRGRPRKDGTTGAASPKQKTIPVSGAAVVSDNAVHLANAEMITKGLDLLRAAVSGGECAANEQMREACKLTWAEWLETEGVSLPPWAQLAIVSTVYVSPAFATPKGQGIIKGTFAKMRGWWIARRG